MKSSGDLMVDFQVIIKNNEIKVPRINSNSQLVNIISLAKKMNLEICIDETESYVQIRTRS